MNELLQCRHGKMLFNVNDRYVGKSLQLYGEFSEGECVVFQQLVRAGWTVLELGANIGAHTLLLSRLVGPRGKVIAFEPQRIVFQTLCANIALNSVLNVDAKQQAVGSSNGTILVPQLDFLQANNFAGLSLEGAMAGETVAQISIDDLNLKSCQFIKMDIEGMEREAVLGASRTLRRLKPILYVENDRRDKSGLLIQSLLELDYNLYWHMPPLYNPANFFGHKLNIFEGIVSRNMVCIHRSLNQDVNSKQIITPRDW